MTSQLKLCPVSIIWSIRNSKTTKMLPLSTFSMPRNPTGQALGFSQPLLWRYHDNNSYLWSSYCVLSPQLLAGDGMMTQGRHNPVSWSLYSGDQGGGDIVLGIMEGFPEKEPIGQNSEGLMTRNEHPRQGKQGPCGCVASVGIAKWASGRSSGWLEPGKAGSRITLEK